MISTILFDLDGVLIDAKEWHYEALNRALGLFGFSISRFEHVSQYDGLPTTKKLKMLSAEKGLPVALHGVIDRVKQVYTREEILRKCRPSFEKEYMLSRLRREGFTMAVCSNSRRESVQMMLTQAGLIGYFDFLLSNEDVVKAKPDPEVYEAALSRAGSRPEETVIIEDAPHGIEAARRSGAHVCQVAGFSEVDYQRVRSFIDGVSRKDKN